MHVTGWGLPDPGQGIPVSYLTNGPLGWQRKKEWLAWIESAGKSLQAIRLYIHRSYTSVCAFRFEGAELRKSGVFSADGWRGRWWDAE